MIKVGIVGATGYTARYLIGYILRHPTMELVAATSRNPENQTVADSHPSYYGQIDLAFQSFDIEPLVRRGVQCVFSCLPHAASAYAVKKILAAGIRVVDFSADYRLNDVATFETWYNVEHPDPDRVGSVPYGMPELFRDDIRNADLVANPGCFPTSAIIPIAPLIKAKLVETKEFIIDSKTGISGAGRTPKPHLHFPECNESVAAYAIGKHRHGPEIQQILLRKTNVSSQIIFTPHLIPMDRGILSTIYLDPTVGTKVIDIKGTLAEAYHDEPFVRLVEQPPATKNVSGSNFCDIFVGECGNKIIISSVIDNLIKGASGAAIQNFNLMYDFPETTALL
ncbi:MAG: N-acetyl-gamma-glutamyl-phosphate reductase [Planctomycetota bacterium]